jgi:hypothetical protein
MMSAQPIARNIHPQLRFGRGTPERFITSHFRISTKKYTSIPRRIVPTRENIFHRLVLTKKNARISKRNVVYEVSCRLVRGKGSDTSQILATGAIIPVKKLTTASIPACEREKVIYKNKCLYTRHCIYYL